MIYKIFELKQKVKKIFQRLLRRNRLADIDVWNAYGTMAERMLPVLEAYYKMEKHGVPSEIAQKHTETDSMDEACSEWDYILEEMIFALRCLILDGSFETQKGKKFLKEYGYGNPNAEDEQHKVSSYTYFIKNKDVYQMTFNETLEETENVILDDIFEYYSNKDLLDEMEERAKKGFELLTKYFFDLWD